jgi:hypothetical protein
MKYAHTFAGTYRVPSHISFNSLPFSGEAEETQASASFFLRWFLPSDSIEYRREHPDPRIRRFFDIRRGAPS